MAAAGNISNDLSLSESTDFEDNDKSLTQAVCFKARQSRNSLAAQELIKIYQMLLMNK